MWECSICGKLLEEKKTKKIPMPSGEDDIGYEEVCTDCYKQYNKTIKYEKEGEPDESI